MLQEAECARFLADGFIVCQPALPKGLNQRVIDQANAAYAAAGHDIGEGAQSSSPIGNNILACVPLLEEVFSAPDVDGALRSLLGENYLIHPHRRPHQKDPRERAQTLHKDSHYGFEFHRSHMPWWVMAMYYPQETTEDMAPTSICPGTQFYAGEEKFDARHMEDTSQLEKWQSEEIRITCGAGTVVICHNDVWHRGTANTSDARRWMFCFMFLRTSPPVAGPAPPGNQLELIALEAARVRGQLAVAFRRPILRFVASWLRGTAAPWLEPVDVPAVARTIEAAVDDQTRLEAVYTLALAPDTAGATAALAKLLMNTLSEPVRRAVKFGAAAACHQQLRSGVAGGAQMVEALLAVLVGRPPAIVACAARALAEHGAWANADSCLRTDVARKLVDALRGQASLPREVLRCVEGSDGRRANAGGTRGIVKTWFRDRGFGFISGTISTSVNGTQIQEAGEVWCSEAAAGGGELLPGEEVWFDVVSDPRTGKLRAERVGGVGVFAFGGRAVGVRNARACLFDALAAVPCDAEEPAAAIAAEALIAELGHPLRSVSKIFGTPAMQGHGECLHFVTLGVARLASRLGHSATSKAKWWSPLQKALVSFIKDASSCTLPSGGRKGGSGGTPGADNGLRYALQFALDALLRAGDVGALREALECLPAASRCAPTAEGLRLRWCHLTNQAHSF